MRTINVLMATENEYFEVLDIVYRIEDNKRRTTMRHRAGASRFLRHYVADGRNFDAVGPAVILEDVEIQFTALVTFRQGPYEVTHSCTLPGEMKVATVRMSDESKNDAATECERCGGVGGSHLLQCPVAK